VKSIKVVIIGAGSASFGLSSLSTLLREPALRGSTIALSDINAEGLRLVHKLAERMNQEWDSGVTIESSPDRRALLEGADFVACTIEVGPREELWRQDWELTLRHGLRQPYAENGGPGGFAHAARNVPQILDIARDMEELCPRALFLNLTNPVPRLCRALTKYTPIKVVGLCHQIGYGYGMAGVALAEHFGLEVPPVLQAKDPPRTHAEWALAAPFREQLEGLLDIKAAGLNHFTWMLDVRDRRTGEDLYPKLRESFLADPMGREPLTRDMLRLTGYLPVPGDTHMSEYLHYVHNPSTKPWERYHLHLYAWDQAAQDRDTGWQRIARLGAEGGPDLDSLRTAQSEGLFEVIHGVGHDANTYRVAADVPNQGAITNLPAHTIVETPVVISGLGVLPVHVGALPPVVAELCRREAERVELAVEAAVTGSRQVALQALAIDPTVDDLDMARAVLDDILETHRAYLPQFHGRWHWES
jgi:alpha-galactosidase/6-phospho-beta-glucosidase family protein